jgi:hypothetical protein
MARRIDAAATLVAALSAGLALLLFWPAGGRAEQGVGTNGSVSDPLSTAWLAPSAPWLPVPPEGPACRPDPPAASRSAAALAELRARLAAEMAAAQGDPDAEGFVVLNGRGHNYGPAETTDPSLLEFEARRLSR